MAYRNVTSNNIVVRYKGTTILFDGSTPTIGYSFSPSEKMLMLSSNNGPNGNSNPMGTLKQWSGYNSDPPPAFIYPEYLGTAGLYNYLKASGDYVEIYNKNIGPVFSLLVKYDRTAGGSTYVACGIHYFGTTTYDQNTFAIAGGGYGFNNWRFVIGWAINEESEKAWPYVCTAYDDNYGGGGACGRTWSVQWSRSDFNNTFSKIAYLIFSDEYVPPTPSSDPYSGGGTSTGTTTGTGTFDDTSDAIANPSAPTLSPSIGSFVNQYVVSANALSNFGTWLYSGGNIFDNLAKVFQSPMEAIINVGILPYDPTYDPNAYVSIKVGGLNSNVQGRLITNNYEVIDMGTLDFDPFYGSALDYNPYTKCYIYLPYCGTFPLNVDEIMGHEISLKYYCDSLSGDCVAVISDEERVLEQFRGNIFIQIPITARDFSSIYTNALNSAISLAAGIATVAATGGVSAPVAVGMGTSMASNAMNSKTHYSRSGGFSGVAGFMSVQTPYVMITIPRQCLPDKQNEMQGYPLFVTKRLGDFSGFTKVYEIHLDGLDCTDAEAKEIYELLKGGVVL